MEESGKEAMMIHGKRKASVTGMVRVGSITRFNAAGRSFVTQLLEFTRAGFEALSDLPTVAANRHHQAANVRRRSFLDHAQERAGSRHSSSLSEM